MITRFIQNLADRSHFVHPHAGTTQWLSPGSNESLFMRTIQSLKGKIVEAHSHQLRKTEIRNAVKHLHGLTDEQLLDMGITRMDISQVVRHGKV